MAIFRRGKGGGGDALSAPLFLHLWLDYLDAGNFWLTTPTFERL